MIELTTLTPKNKIKRVLINSNDKICIQTFIRGFITLNTPILTFSKYYGVYKEPSNNLYKSLQSYLSNKYRHNLIYSKC